MPQPAQSPQQQPRVTAIVSTYGAERFIRGCMEDLVAQTIFNDIEVIVIDSGSPQGESAIVSEFVAQHPQIRLLRTEREPLYAAWNRAIKLAKGQYLTSANTDDRHRKDAFEILANTLDQVPEVGLVYADQWISYVENEDFASCELRKAAKRRWPEYTPVDLLLRCITGSQPMWRRDLHATLGDFDTRYTIVADFDMWLRIAQVKGLRHLPHTLGVLFCDENTISGATNRRQMNLEVLSVQRRYSMLLPWRHEPNVRPRLAAEIFGRGYQHIESGEGGAVAEPFFREAIRLNPFSLNYLKTYFLRCILRIA